MMCGFGLQERSRVMLRFADLVEKHSEELAALESWDNGKTYEQALTAEIPMVARLFRYYAGIKSFRNVPGLDASFCE